MPTFEGCVQAREISLCPIELGGGANPKAHALVLKSMAPKAETPPEKTSMTDAEKAAQAAEIRKAALKQTTAIAAMSEVTKAHFLALGDDAQLAFLEKSAADQATEAETAKAATDRAAAEAEALKAGKSVREMELEKSLADQRAEIDALKAHRVNDEIEKRASTEFAGYPGGNAAVVPLLKAYATLPDEVRKASEELLKAQAVAALGMTKAFGGRTEQDVSKQAGAQVRLEEAVKAYIAEHKVSRNVAIEKVSEMPQYADDVALAFES